jgi:hypothetical protein
MHSSHRQRGLTITEVVFVLVIIAGIVALLLPAFQKARCGGVPLKVKTQIVHVHKAVVLDSNNHNGVFATPGLIQPRLNLALDPDASVIDQDFSLNHSAPLYSYLLMSKLVTPEALVSDVGCGCCEVNGGVVVKNDYNFDAYNPAANCFWDTTFTMRIDSPKIGANCSYAHAAICGDRRINEWRNSQKPGVAMFGTRGTRNGVLRGDDYTKSPTLRFHGPKNQWVGHVVFNDGHAETLNTFFAPLSVYSPDGNSGPKKDNLYAAEFPSAHGNQAVSDNFLGVFTGSTEFTVNDVYDPLEN